MLKARNRLIENVLKIKKSALAFALRKHAYSNILKILPPKTENFQIKILIFFFFIFFIKT